jgi:glucokinase
MRWIGVDVGATNTKLVRLGDDLAVAEHAEFKTEGELGPARFVERLAQALTPWIGARGDQAAVGLAVAGLVSGEGSLQEAPNLQAFEGFPLAAELSARLGGAAVAMENDVNAAVYAETRVGAARGLRHVLMLALGTGVGGGLVIDGELYRGARGVAGEFGHMTLQIDGPHCSCGRQGHVEAYLGTTGIVTYAGQRFDAASDEQKQPLLRRCREEGGLTPRALALAAADGDPLSVGILGDVGRLLGVVCANLANALNPEAIVIGGGIALAGDPLLKPAGQALKAWAMRPTAEHLQLLAAQLGNQAAAIGAALLARAPLDGGGSRAH